MTVGEKGRAVSIYTGMVFKVQGTCYSLYGHVLSRHIPTRTCQKAVE